MGGLSFQTNWKMWQPFKKDLKWCINPGIKNLSLMVRYVFTEPWCPANKLVWYNVMVLSAHISSMANSAVCLSGVVTNLNSRESNKIKHSAKISTLCIALLLFGNYFELSICINP